MILTKYIATSPNSRIEFLTEQERDTYIAENEGFENGGMVKEEIIEPEPVHQPWEVALARIRFVLKRRGLIPTIESAIDSIQDEETKDKAISFWEYGNVIDRYSNTVMLIQQVCNLSDEQTDEIFRQAEALTL